VAQWPTELLEMYLDDAVGQRAWVDSKNTVIFVQNIVYWAGEGRDADSRLLRRKGDEDDSSGDEEVMEDGDHPVVSENKAAGPVYDRYLHCVNDVTAIVINFLSLKAGMGPATADSATGRPGVAVPAAPAKLGNVVKTVATFCELPKVRKSFGAPFIIKLLGNPALVDDVRKLTSRISECFQLDATSGSFIESDMVVLDGIVALRHSLKSVSHIEWHKNLLSAAASKSFFVASRILKLLLSEDAEGTNSRQESIKLVSAVLQSLHQVTWEVDMVANNYNLVQSVLDSITRNVDYVDIQNACRASYVFGFSVGQLFADIVFRSKYAGWTGVQLKVLVDMIYKVLRLVFVKPVDLVVVAVQLMIGFSSRNDLVSLIPSAIVEDVVYLVGDMCVFCQLMVAHDFCHSEKEIGNLSKEYQVLGTNSKLYGLAASSRPRPTLDSLPPMFRGAKSRMHVVGLSNPAGAGFGGMQSLKRQRSEEHDEKKANLAEPAKLSGKIHPRDASLGAIRAIQAAAVIWVKALVLNSSEGAPIKTSCPYLVRKVSHVTAGSAPPPASEFWCDWLALTQSLQLSSLSRLGADFEKGAAFLLKDFGMFGSSVGDDLVTIATALCAEPSATLGLLNIIDNCIQRAFRTDLIDAKTGLLCDDIQVC
jgi:hypothetical protein